VDPRVVDLYNAGQTVEVPSSKREDAEQAVLELLHA
jgi:hypothetical protein